MKPKNLNIRIEDEKLFPFSFVHNNLAISYIPVDYVSIDPKKSRCRLLIIYPVGQYHCLAFGRIKTPKVCNPCPNPAHQAVSIGITEGK